MDSSSCISIKPTRTSILRLSHFRCYVMTSFCCVPSTRPPQQSSATGVDIIIIHCRAPGRTRSSLPSSYNFLFFLELCLIMPHIHDYPYLYGSLSSQMPHQICHPPRLASFPIWKLIFSLSLALCPPGDLLPESLHHPDPT